MGSELSWLCCFVGAQNHASRATDISALTKHDFDIDKESCIVMVTAWRM